MSVTWMGLVAGLALGFAGAFGGIVAFVVVAAVGAAGVAAGWWAETRYSRSRAHERNRERGPEWAGWSRL